MGVLDTWNKANNAWLKVRDFGSGLGTYFVGLSMVFSGVAALLAELGDKDLAWILANFHTIQNGNAYLMIGTGLGFILHRRATATVQNEVKKLTNGNGHAPQPPTPQP